MNRREVGKAIIASAVAAAMPKRALAGFGPFARGGGASAMSWHTLKVGSGGFVRGLNIVSDGTMVVRTDTNGGYLYNGSSWTQLVNPTSIPSALIDANPVQFGTGVFEIQIAPTDSNTMYMVFQGYVFKSTNKGATWTQTAFTQVSASTSANANDNYAQYGQKIAIDPHNANIVFVGTEANGLFLTTDGGTTWSSVTGVPAGTNAGVTGILFYGSGPVSGGATQTLYAASYGNGVYVSTNGGSTWTITTGGPTNVQYAAIDTSGNYYAVGNSGANVFKYSGGTWTTTAAPSTGTLQAIAINPFNISEVVAVNQGGQITVSYDAGSTWTASAANTSLVSTDIPWLVDANSFNGVPGPNFFLDAGGLAFSPTTNGELYLSAGTGTWVMALPGSGVTSSTPLTWTDFSVGIEQLVANAILVPPVTGSVPILASWDRPFFKITDLSTYPSTYGSVNSDKIEMGWSLDYASSDPTFIVGLSDWNIEQTGYSTDGGATWTYFSAFPPGSLTSYLGGTIAASTPQNIIWAPANKTNPYYTTDQGATWTAITLPGVSSWANFDYAYYLVTRTVAADRVNANTFYLYYAGYGVFKSTDGGAAWTNVYNGNGGYIESNSSWSGKNSMIMSVPGNAGHLFYTSGWQSGTTEANVTQPFYRSTDGGATWAAVSNVLGVSCFGFGAIAAGQTYPSIFIVGFVGSPSVFGIWRSDDNAASWTKIGDYPLGGLDLITCISGDPNIYGRCYVGFSGGGYAYYG